MDRRTFLFLILMAITFFGMNLFFAYHQQSHNQEWVEVQEKVKAQKQKELSAEISRRTLTKDELPLVEVDLDKAGTKPATTAVQSEGGLLLLGWTEALPKEVYVAGRLFTLKAANGVDQPAIYLSADAKVLKVAEPSELGTYELQVVTPSMEQPKTVSIALGELKDGHFHLVANQLNPELRQKFALPTSNSIVLRKTGSGFLPIGVYEAATKEFKALNAFSLPALSPILEASLPAANTKETSEQKFYVLQNDYQQIVLTNVGGAIVEINLPFESETNHVSLVKEIETDREMIERFPADSLFPAHPYAIVAADGKSQEVAKGQLGGYYPLLRRGVFGKEGRIVSTLNPHYYALNIVSEYPETAERVYQVKQFTQDTIVFETVQAHRRITKTYSLKQNPAAPYAIELTVDVDGTATGLWITSGIPEVELISNAPAPALKLRLLRNSKGEVEQLDLPKDAVTVSSVHPDWVCNSNGFFGLILDPLSEIDAGYKALRVSARTAPSRLTVLDANNDKYKAGDLPGYEFLLPLKESGGSMRFRLYAGPFSDTILTQVDEALSDPETGYNPKYVDCQSYFGIFTTISEPFSKFLLLIMNAIHALTGSWALSIFLVTVVLRIMMYPLNAWSMKSMGRMQQINPEVQALQEKFKKDPRKAQMAVMNLYRERGVNPISGCFPMLIQMPFLIGMYDLLKSNFELRGASFIPGWIDNLASPDVLFSWSTPIFFVGTEFHLLPVLLGATMFLQQRLMAPPVDVNNMTDQQRQQRAMGTMMTVVFTVMFYNFPSGLNIYWLSSTLLGALQQWYTTKQIASTPLKPIVEVQIPAKKPSGGKGR